MFERKKLLARSERFSNLYASDDFREWKTAVVDKRLEELKKSILSSDPYSSNHSVTVLRYQELKFVTEDIFKMWEITEKNLRKDLERAKKLAKKLS